MFLMFLNKKIITKIKSKKTLIGNAEGKKIAEINIMFLEHQGNILIHQIQTRSILTLKILIALKTLRQKYQF